MTPHRHRSALSTLRRTAAAVGLAGALLVGSAGVAAAESWSYTDGAGDVRSYLYDEEAEYLDEVGSPAPERTIGDVRRFAVSHQTSTVALRLTMRKGLPRDGWYVNWRIKTPTSVYELIVARFEFGGFVFLVKGTSGPVKCKALAVKYTSTSIQASVPRSCLGNPSAIRVGAGVQTEEGDRAYVDDALRAPVGDYLKMSPPVRRG